MGTVVLIPWGDNLSKPGHRGVGYCPGTGQGRIKKRQKTPRTLQVSNPCAVSTGRCMRPLSTRLCLQIATFSHPPPAARPPLSPAGLERGPGMAAPAGACVVRGVCMCAWCVHVRGVGAGRAPQGRAHGLWCARGWGGVTMPRPHSRGPTLPLPLSLAPPLLQRPPPPLLLGGQ